MEKEFEDIKFKYIFRDYQKEALDMLDKYKNDKKIHIVASPGAGKTILALELLLRIGNKALVLAPTIAIKEQWVERLRKDFINGDKDNLISTDLENPSIITIVTYQALYALKRKKIDVEKIINKNNIKTIVLDEAHHLRKIWFKTLKTIVDKLKDCAVVSLTATPPYDNGNDFSNYMSLCGDIDVKITVPQLVKSNCLCPHQDYIYFNIPTEEQEQKLNNYRKAVNEFINYLKNNSNFIKALAINDYIIDADNYVKEILNEFDFYISLLSFLKEVGIKYPINKFNRKIEIPKFENSLMEIILERYLYGKDIEEIEIYKDTFKDIKERLNLLGSVYEKKISFKYTKELSDILLKNAGKLDSISKIIDSEYNTLKEKLKLVVVTDFIKEEYYDVLDASEINTIGAMPIFRKVIDTNLNVKAAMLTGTYIIIPTDLKERLYDIAKKEYDILEEEIKVQELGIDFNYSRVEFLEKHKRYSVNLITKLFHESDISVLIGTVALIGEGWDAPFINSLIMASFVSSYVTSNQVRGRAIRIDKKEPEKVSNIWHLICLEKSGNEYILGQDYEMLSKRFLAYDGLNFDFKKIDSGIERLNIVNRKYSKNEIEYLNNEMKYLSVRRNEIDNCWNTALKKYIPVCKEEIPIEKLYKNKTGRYRLARNSMYSFTELVIDAWIYTSVAAMILPAESLGLIIANRFIFDRYINSELYFIKKCVNAVYRSMKKKNMLGEKVSCYARKVNNKIEFGLKNADTHEQLTFIKYVKQCMVLDISSRYIVKSGRHIYVVPECFSKNKTDAESFLKELRIFGPAELIYTRSEKGEKLLLRYRMNEFNKKLY